MSNPHVKSLTANLKRVAKAKDVPYDKVLTQFLIERATMRLVADAQLYQMLTFKGGYVSLAVYGSPRFTTDLDAVLHGNTNENARARILEALTKDLGDHAWYSFEKEIELETQNEYGGMRQQFRAGIGEIPADKLRSQVLNIDIGTGDPITPAAIDEHTITTLGTDEISWRVYPIETMIAEKLHPLIALGPYNSRSKDLFDLSFYLPKAKPDVLKEAISKTFSYRGTIVPVGISELVESLDKELLRRGWSSATTVLQPKPDFDKTIGSIVNLLRSYGI